MKQTFLTNAKGTVDKCCDFWDNRKKKVNTAEFLVRYCVRAEDS